MGPRRIKIISATQNANGYLYYYVEYYGEGGNPGKRWWDQEHLPKTLQDFLYQNAMVDCCLGLGMRGEVNYVARSAKRIMFQLPAVGPGQKEKPSDLLARGYDFCSIGVGGAFCVRKGEKMLYSPLGEDKMVVVRELEKDGRLKGMYFGGGGMLVLRHN